MSVECKIVPTPEGTESSPQSDRCRSTLALISNQLKENLNVFPAGEIRCYDKGGLGNSSLVETVTIVIAPNHPQFDAKELTRFMDNLIKGVKPSYREAAEELDNGGIRFGRVRYDETIGKIWEVTNTIIKTTEPEVIEEVGGVVGESQSKREEELRRRIWLRVCSDNLSATDLYRYEKKRVENRIIEDIHNELRQNLLEPDQIQRLKAQLKGNAR